MQTLAYIGPAQTESEIIYSLINSKGPVAVDVETVSLKNQTPIGIGLQWSDVDRAYFGLFPECTRYLDVVQGILRDPSRTKIYHNGKAFDLVVLSSLAMVDDINVHDTYYMARSLGIEANLDYIGKNLLGFQDMFTIPQLLQETAEDLEVKVNKVTMLDVPFSYTARKCMNDVRATWFAYQRLPELMNAQMLECYEIDRRLIHIVREMEKKGLSTDQEVLLERYEKLKETCAKYETWAAELGFNINSPGQVAMYLANKGIVLPLTKSGNSLSSGLEALIDHLDDEDIWDILQHRKYKTQLTKFVTPYIGKDKVHTEFRFDLATGRFASEGENWQNIPPELRDLFQGPFTWLDFSQIELRLFAHYSQDPVMLDIYSRPDGDIHFSTQQAIWPGSDKSNDALRLAAKTVNFSMVFNARPGTILRSIKKNAYKSGVKTKVDFRQVKNFREVWLNTHKGGKLWMEAQMQRREPWATTLFGRRMRLPDGPTEDHIQKCRINYPIQGTAADIIKRAMLICAGVHGLDTRVQVHDELVYDGSVPDVVFTELGLDSILGDYKIPYNVKRGPKWI